MKVIVYTIDGVLQRVVPAEGVEVESLDISRLVPKGVAYSVVENDTMPNAILRDAWTQSGRDVVVDVTKGKVVAHDVRREKRTAYMTDNIALITKGALGVPLNSGESVEVAQQANADYKTNVDDVVQSKIDGARSESDLLLAIGKL